MLTGKVRGAGSRPTLASEVMLVPVQIEGFDPERHDDRAAADLVYSVDAELGPLVFGRTRPEAVRLIRRLMNADDTWYSPGHLTCAVSGGYVVGVAAAYPVSIRDTVDLGSARELAREMGRLRFVMKVPLLLRIGQLLGGEMDPEGCYLNVLCVHPQHRGRGIGTQLVTAAGRDHPLIYLHADSRDEGLRGFYEGLGFQVQSTREVRIAGRRRGMHLMRRSQDGRGPSHQDRLPRPRSSRANARPSPQRPHPG